MSKLDLGDVVAEELQSIWGDLNEGDRDLTLRVARQLQHLLGRAAGGEHVAPLIAETREQIRDLEFAGSSTVKRGIWRAVERWAPRIAAFLGGLAGAALSEYASPRDTD